MELRDPETARKVVSLAIAPHGLSISGRVHGRFEAVDAGRVSVGRLSYGPDADLTVPSLPDRYVMVLPADGTVTVRTGNVHAAEEVAVGGHTAAALRAGDSFRLVFPAGAAAVLVRVGRAVVLERLSAALGEPIVEPVAFARRFSLQDEVGSRVLRAIGVLEAAAGLADDALALVGEAVAAQLLRAVPHQYSARLLHPTARSPLVRAAMDFLDEHAGQPLTVTEVAAASGVGVRRLQAAFDAELGVTPMAYLRTVRLHRAHADLVAAAPSASVTGTAMRWQFFNVGRFAREYRRCFGVAPSATARGQGPVASMAE